MNYFPRRIQKNQEARSRGNQIPDKWAAESEPVELRIVVADDGRTFWEARTKIGGKTRGVTATASQTALEHLQVLIQMNVRDLL